MVTLKFSILIFVRIKWPITKKKKKKKQRRRFDKMNVDRNIKVPDLILSTLLISKTDIGLKRFFRKLGTILKLCDFKNGGCLTFLVAARQP